MESTTPSAAPSSPAVPSPPPWYFQRPFLTGRFHQEAKSSSSPHWRFDSSSSRDENPVTADSSLLRYCWFGSV
ncbi:Gamma-tubulin complex component 2-like protein, partial [Drosera capensis]